MSLHYKLEEWELMLSKMITTVFSPKKSILDPMLVLAGGGWIFKRFMRRNPERDPG